MTKQPDNNGDRQISDLYRDSSSETAPDALNRAVLAEAARVGTSARMATLFAWCRPLAFAATLLLGVALVYDMQTVLQDSDVPYELMPESLDDRSDPVSRAADVAPETVNRQGKPSALKPGAGPTPRADASMPANRKIATPPIEEKTEQPAQQPAVEKRQVRQVTDQPRLQPQGMAAPAAALRATAQESMAADSTAEFAASTCNDQRQASVDEWWQCVRHLRANGEESAADEEWQRLKARYPDFEEPR